MTPEAIPARRMPGSPGRTPSIKQKVDTKKMKGLMHSGKVQNGKTLHVKSQGQSERRTQKKPRTQGKEKKNGTGRFRPRDDEGGSYAKVCPERKTHPHKKTVTQFAFNRPRGKWWRRKGTRNAREKEGKTGHRQKLTRLGEGNVGGRWVNRTEKPGATGRKEA